jgi:hypothetical protein
MEAEYPPIMRAEYCLFSRLFSPIACFLGGHDNA